MTIHPLHDAVVSNPRIVQVCKPPTRSHPAYARLMAFIRERVEHFETSGLEQSESGGCGANS